MYYLGIDFGTSFTKAVVYDSKTDRDIPIAMMPTVAMNTAGGILIGEAAENAKQTNVGSFYYNFKTELDTAPDDKIELYEPIIQKFLDSIKKAAEAKIRQTFDEVVLTIPACAPEGGRRYMLMQRCAKKVGFKDVIIMYEPEAAAYCLLDGSVHSPAMQDKQFLIYDFGGGTFDTSIIKLSDNQIFVIDESVGSDNRQKWGGIYIDQIVRNDFIERSTYAQQQCQNLKSSRNAIDRFAAADNLRRIPVRAKERLSISNSFTHQQYTLTREDFNDMIIQMVDNTRTATIDLLDNASKEKRCDDISAVKTVFLVGGTSQIPLVKQRWEFVKQSTKDAKFDIVVKKELDVIARGAARYRHLRLSSNELIKRGKKFALQGNYKKADAYFNNADPVYGKFYIGLLYYLGAIGRKRQPAKAFKLFLDSNQAESGLMCALMLFKGDGVRKNDDDAFHSLKWFFQRPDTDGHKLADCLHRVLKGEIDARELDYIYNFDVTQFF